MKKLSAVLSFIIAMFFCCPAYADLSDGLVAYYPFNGNANDESGNGNHGSVVGATPTVDRFGNADSAFEFSNNPVPLEPAQDYITIPDDVTLRPSNGLTVSAWTKTSNSAGCHIVGKQFGSDTQNSYLLWYGAGSSSLMFCIYPYPTTELSTPIPTLDEWHLVTGTYDGSYLRLYVDSVEVDNMSYSESNDYDSNPVIIGADDNNEDDVPDRGWDGTIDEVRIYNRALSDEEIRQLYCEGLNFPGDNLWNIRGNRDDRFHETGPWIRPWRTTYDDGWGIWVGEWAYEIEWYDGPFTQNSGSFDSFYWSTDCYGSLSCTGGQDHQFHAWTYVYVSSPTTLNISDTTHPDCLARIFLNEDFDNPYNFPVSFDLPSRGWHRIDITGYNQHQAYSFNLNYPLADNVDIMNSEIFAVPVPAVSEWGIIIIFILLIGSALWVIRRRKVREST